MATTEDKRGLEGGAAEWKRELFDATPERGDELSSTISGPENERARAPRAALPALRERAALLTRERRHRLRHHARLPGRVSVHTRRLPVDVPREALDDAPVRGLRHRRGDERALPLPARARADGAVHGLRHAHADGLRLRPSALARGGRARGRGDRLARRHGDALLAAPPRPGLDVADDPPRS